MADVPRAPDFVACVPDFCVPDFATCVPDFGVPDFAAYQLYSSG